MGVTGTNGKTTTAFLIKDMLETVLRTRVGLIGTVQNMVGDEILRRGAPRRRAMSFRACCAVWRMGAAPMW